MRPRRDTPPPLTASVDVAAPAQAVWEALVDWPAHGRWVPLTRVHVTAGGGQGVGAAFEGWTGLGPVGVRDPMTIVEWEPPHRCSVRKTGRVVRGSASFAVTPAPAGGSRVTWTEQIDPPGGALGALAWRAALPVSRAGLRAVLRRFARDVVALHP